MSAKTSTRKPGYVHTTACADQRGCKEPTVGKSRYCVTHRADSRARFRAFLAARAAERAVVTAPVVSEAELLAKITGEVGDGFVAVEVAEAPKPKRTRKAKAPVAA